MDDSDTLILDDTDENLDYDDDDEEAQFFADEVGVGSNLEHNHYIEKFPQFDTMRISSHGEFIDEDLYDSSSIKNDTSDTVTFNIHFRGKIGSTVLVRCNTADMYIDGNKYCSSFIGKQDFYKNMVIKYNKSGIQGITVEGCETDIVPELLLSFDDDFANGYALYNDHFPLGSRNDRGICIQLKLFEINGVSKTRMKLIDVLKFTYDRMNVKSAIIDIYVSACLYIRPEQLEDIKDNYRDWYNCNVENIKEGYEKELEDINKNIKITDDKIETCKNAMQEITRRNNDKSIKFYIDVLGNIRVKEGYGDYVYNYLISEQENIGELDELINDYMDEHSMDVDLEQHNDKYIKDMSNKISIGLSQKLRDDGQSESKIEQFRKKLELLVTQLVRYKLNNKALIKAISQCSIAEPTIDYVKPIKPLSRTRTIRPGHRYKPYGGGSKKKKKKKRSLSKIMRCLKLCKLKKLTKKKKKKKK